MKQCLLSLGLLGDATGANCLRCLKAISSSCQVEQWVGITGSQREVRVDLGEDSLKDCYDFHAEVRDLQNQPENSL